MADGLRKNWQRVREGIRDWWWALKDTWDDLGAAADDRDVGEIFHLLTRIINDTVKLPHRLWTYLIVFALVTYLGSLTGVYHFPVAVRWAGF